MSQWQKPRIQHWRLQFTRLIFISTCFAFSALKAISPKDSSQTIRTLYREAESALQLGDVTTAVQKFTALTHYPQTKAPAYARLAYIDFSKGLFSNALARIEIAILTEPENEDYLILKAEILEKSKDYKASGDLYFRCINLHPNFYSRYSKAAHAYHMGGLWTSLTTLCQKWVNQFQLREEMAYYYLEAYQKQHKSDSFLFITEQFLKRYPSNLKYLNYYVNACKQYEQKHRGISFLQNLIGLDSQNLALKGAQIKIQLNTPFNPTPLPADKNVYSANKTIIHQLISQKGVEANDLQKIFIPLMLYCETDTQFLWEWTLSLPAASKIDYAYQLAEKYFNLGSFYKAATLFELFTTDNNPNLNATFYNVFCYYQTKQFSKINGQLDLVSEYFPFTSFDKVKQAYSNLEQKNYAAVVSIFPLEKTKDAYALNLLLLANIQLQNTQACIEIANKLGDINVYSVLHLQLASLLLEKHQTDLALKHFKLAENAGIINQTQLINLTK